MTPFRIVILLVLLLAILGGSGYFFYENIYLPKKQVQLEKKAAAQAVPTPTPDYSIAEFTKIEPLQKDGKLVEARDAYLTFIGKYPNSSKLTDAKKAVGDLNMQMLFSDFESPNKEQYSVVKGDAIAKIASKTKTSMELIYRANNMSSINLQIGQILIIPKLQPSIQIHRKSSTLTLLDNGVFLKEYPLLSFKGPGAAGSPINTTIREKASMQGDKRVAFGTKEYANSDHWLLLGSSGIIIKSAPEPPADGTEPVLPGGIVLSHSDMDELFALVNKGTPVTID